MRHAEREITERTEILKIVEKAKVCRIALHDQPYPYIVPLNFGVEPGEPIIFYFHCAVEGRKLELIRKNNKAGFEIEVDTTIISGKKACDWTMNYQSVIGTGSIEIIEKEGEKIHGLIVLMRHYSPQKEFGFTPSLLKRTRVLKLRVDSISGKQHGVF